jgi:hypothetical protein
MENPILIEILSGLLDWATILSNARLNNFKKLYDVLPA